MTDRYLIPFNGRLLVLDADSFAKAAAEGAQAIPADAQTVPRGPQKLLTADELADMTGTPATWFLTAARLGEIPHVKLGKYVRFDFDDVKAKFNVPATVK